MNIQAVRGFNDILPDQSAQWQYLESCIQKLAHQYAYTEIRLPVLEHTELFIRSVGEETDIVEKEIYTFEDRNGDSLSLRPEGTAGCVRAGIEHGLLYNQIQRWWYAGPMFRHERPQAGRYRQFAQIGFEAFGIAEPYMDVELITLTARLWRVLNLTDAVHLHINTLGSLASRQRYRQHLMDYFRQHWAVLDEESQKRLPKNPLRLLDSKNPAMADVIAQAPRLMDYLESECQAHFDCVQTLLAEQGIPFTVNPCLVRGLDYYTRTVFEWVGDTSVAQATVCAGGRYDGLVEFLGGKPTPAVGFAMGLERILLLLQSHQKLPQVRSIDFYVLSVGEASKAYAGKIAEQLRDAFPQHAVVNDVTLSSFKAQIKRADKQGARFALIIGEDELKAGTIAIKFLREEKLQETIGAQDLIHYLSTYL